MYQGLNSGNLANFMPRQNQAAELDALVTRNYLLSATDNTLELLTLLRSHNSLIKIKKRLELKMLPCLLVAVMAINPGSMQAIGKVVLEIHSILSPILLRHTQNLVYP